MSDIKITKRTIGDGLHATELVQLYQVRRILDKDYDVAILYKPQTPIMEAITDFQVKAEKAFEEALRRVLVAKPIEKEIA